MARLTAVSALLLSPLPLALSQPYQLIQEYNASNIFEEFRFYDGPDLTTGFVQYVPFEAAATARLIGNTSDLIYLGVDNTNIYTPGGLGRPSVRLESKATFTEGLFVIDLTHIPVGCGTWPAFWTTGLSDWPADGEIDIIESVNDARTNNAAIHATGNCSVTEASEKTGIWKSTDCNIVHDDNQGCGTVFTEPCNYGAEFNANGGGVYAMEWASDAIRIWFFPPTNVPSSLQDGTVPDPETFGTPSANFSGPCSDSFGEKFFNHSIIIDTTFCGGWAGGTFGTGSSSCPMIEGLSPQDSCIDYVATHPEAFKEAYWGIRSVKVWEKAPRFTLPGLVTPSVDPLPEIVDIIYEEPVLEGDLDPLTVDDLSSFGAALTIGGDAYVETAYRPTRVPELLDVELSEFVPDATAESELVDVSPLTGGVLINGDSEEDTTSDEEDDMTGNEEEDATSDELEATMTDLEPTSPPITSDSTVDETTSLDMFFETEVNPTPFSDSTSIATSIDVLATDIPASLEPMLSDSTSLGASDADEYSSILSSYEWTSITESAPTTVSTATVFGTSPDHTPPRIWNTEGKLLQLSPKLSLPRPTPRPHGDSMPNGETRMAAPHFEGSPARIPVPPGESIDIPDPKMCVPVPLPLFEPLPNEHTGIVPSELGNPVLPPNGNTGIVPPHLGNNPISGLWGTFSPDVKDKTLAAAKNLPPVVSDGAEMVDNWVDAVRPKIGGLPSLENLPSVNGLPSLKGLPSVNDLPSLNGLPSLEHLPTIKPGGELSGLLDAKTKNKLKSLLAVAASAGPTDVSGMKRQALVPGNPNDAVAESFHTTSTAGQAPGSADKDAVSNPLVEGSLNSTPAVPGTSITLPYKPPEVPNPMLSLVPSVPVTALNTTDTAQTMDNLLSFLDDSTKVQIVDLLLPDDEPTAAAGRQDIDPIFEIDDNDLSLLRDPYAKTLSHSELDENADFVIDPILHEGWPAVEATLSADTKAKIDDIIEKIAFDGASLTGTLFDVLLSKAILPLEDEINAINEEDKKKLVRYITGNGDVESILISLLSMGDETSPGATVENVIDAAKSFVSEPNDDRRASFMETLKNASGPSHRGDDSVRRRAKRRNTRAKEESTNVIRARQTSSQWTPQDKMLLAQNVYSLCPNPALVGIPFPSPNDLAADLLDPNTTVEAALSAFQRKLQAYFDVAVQGCWTKINQWLAWRQLLRKPGINLPNSPFPTLPYSLRTRQESDECFTTTTAATNSGAQALLEQQIYALCPKADVFSATALIADLEDANTSLQTSIARFQNKLWAYMAKLQACSDKIRVYGPKLKSLVGNTDASEPVYHINDAAERLATRQDVASFGGSSPAFLLNLLAAGPKGTRDGDLSPAQKKGLYDALVAGFLGGAAADVGVMGEDDIQDLVLHLIGATGVVGHAGKGGGSGGKERVHHVTSSENPGNGGPDDGAQDDGTQDDSTQDDGTQDDTLEEDLGEEDESSLDSDIATDDTFTSDSNTSDTPALFRPRIVRRTHLNKHQNTTSDIPTATPEENGIISDVDAPPELDDILGQAGTLDPYGMLEPQADDGSESSTPEDLTPTPTDTSCTHTITVTRGNCLPRPSTNQVPMSTKSSTSSVNWIHLGRLVMVMGTLGQSCPRKISRLRRHILGS